MSDRCKILNSENKDFIGVVDAKSGKSNTNYISPNYLNLVQYCFDATYKAATYGVVSPKKSFFKKFPDELLQSKNISESTFSYSPWNDLLLSEKKLIIQFIFNQLLGPKFYTLEEENKNIEKMLKIIDQHITTHQLKQNSKISIDKVVFWIASVTVTSESFLTY